jgi:hypothetical protein
MRCERLIHYNATEDFIPLDNLKGGDQKYDRFIGLSDLGTLAVYNLLKD